MFMCNYGEQLRRQDGVSDALHKLSGCGKCLLCEDGLSILLAAKGYLAQLREAEAAEGSGSEDDATRDAVGQRLRSDALEASTHETHAEDWAVTRPLVLRSSVGLCGRFWASWHLLGVERDGC
jgi:hypothetical protein